MNRKPHGGPAAKPNAPAPGRAGADGLDNDLAAVRRELLSGRHDVYYKLTGILTRLLSESDGSDLRASFERAWCSRSFPTFYERPLLLLAALRADALAEGPEHPLYAALALPQPNAGIINQETVLAALARDRLGVWSIMTTRRMQTNDPTRAVAWLWPAALAGCGGGKRPLALIDIGAGAGLNLVGDQLQPDWLDAESGEVIPCATGLDTLLRIGFDSRPLSVHNTDDVQWMRACIWPGDTARLERFEAAVAALQAAALQPRQPQIERLTASLVPGRVATLAATLNADTFVLAYQTLVAGYMEAGERDSYRQAMLELLLRRTRCSTLWVELEVDDSRRRLPAVLTAHVRAGAAVRSLRLARCSQHPVELEIDAAGVNELKKHLARP
jgi:hypothetical protein